MFNAIILGHNIFLALILSFIYEILPKTILLFDECSTPSLNVILILVDNILMWADDQSNHNDIIMTDDKEWIWKSTCSQQHATHQQQRVFIDDWWCVAWSLRLHNYDIFAVRAHCTQNYISESSWCHVAMMIIGGWYRSSSTPHRQHAAAFTCWFITPSKLQWRRENLYFYCFFIFITAENYFYYY